MSEHMNFPACQICACEEYAFAPRTTCVSCDVPVPQSLVGMQLLSHNHKRLLS